MAGGCQVTFISHPHPQSLTPDWNVLSKFFFCCSHTDDNLFTSIFRKHVTASSCLWCESEPAATRDLIELRCCDRWSGYHWVCRNTCGTCVFIVVSFSPKQGMSGEKIGETNVSHTGSRWTMSTSMRDGQWAKGTQLWGSVVCGWYSLKDEDEQMESPCFLCRFL